MKCLECGRLKPICWLRERRLRRKSRKRCFHHSLGGNPANTERPVSWIRQELVDLGRRKRLWCIACGKVWIT